MTRLPAMAEDSYLHHIMERVTFLKNKVEIVDKVELPRCKELKRTSRTLTSDDWPT